MVGPCMGKTVLIAGDFIAITLKRSYENKIFPVNNYRKKIMYGIAITYAVASLLLLGGFAYITFKMTSKK